MRQVIGFVVVTGVIGICTLPTMADIVIGGAGIGGGATVIDFEGFADSTLIDTQYAGVGVDFFVQDDGGTPMIDKLPMLFAYGSTSGENVLTGSVTGGAPFPTVAGIVAEFSSPQSQAGAMLSDTAPLGDYTISAFGAGGVLIESFILPAASIPFPGEFFPSSASPSNGIYVGFEFDSNVIHSIQFGPSLSVGDAFAIDDVQFVPAPGAALLGMMGLGMAGWVRRRIA